MDPMNPQSALLGCWLLTAHFSIINVLSHLRGSQQPQNLVQPLLKKKIDFGLTGIPVSDDVTDT